MDEPSSGANKAPADKYNVEAAEILANEAQHLPIAEATPIYEQLLLLFPTSAKFWRQYVEAHMAVNNDEATKQIFSRCLLNCLQIPLWRCYIRFIRKVNEKKGTEGQEETRKAFDFMLNYVVTNSPGAQNRGNNKNCKKLMMAQCTFDKAEVRFGTRTARQAWW